MKGHTTRISSIAWSKNDTLVMTCGIDGIVCCWKLDHDLNYPRILCKTKKNCPWSDLVLTNDQRTIFSISA